METKSCQQCKKSFIIEAEDFGFYKKIGVPGPTFCPECRLIRRLSWRNERSLYTRKCDMCGETIISIYSIDYKKNVYCHDCWWSDKWDGRSYGKDVDFSRPFLVQFFELFQRTPVPNLFAFSQINSPYCNMADNMRNCYLLHDGNFDENVSYGSGAFYCTDSKDITMARKCELCYEVVTCINCYRTVFSEKCEDCVDVAFSYGLRGCNNCFGCVNLHQKNYYIFNEPYTKEEYEEKMKSFKLDSYQNFKMMKEKAINFWEKFPQKYFFGVQNVNVTGDYLENSKNSKYCFGGKNLEDSKYISFGSNGPIKQTYDFTHYGDNIELVNESMQCGDGVYNLKFGWGVWSNSKNVSYGILSAGISDCFSCVGLHKKQYCILNKQYTREEYEKLIPKIIEHMNEMPFVDKNGREYRYGEFFPSEFSPFGYNETTAQEYFPLDSQSAAKNGYNWHPGLVRDYNITRNSEELADSISEVSDSILDEVISCEHKGKCSHNCMTAYKILLDDLSFYRRMNLPLPRLCPNCRHHERLKLRNPLKLWHRPCMCDKKDHHNHETTCKEEFETSYSPERPEIIYCEKCYQQEVH
jgi:hypothetical protein